MPSTTPQSVEKETADVRFQSIYRNYRSAIAAENEKLAQSLKKVLDTNAMVAIRLAEESLARAATDLDRDIAQKVLESLRRNP